MKLRPFIKQVVAVLLLQVALWAGPCPALASFDLYEKTTLYLLRYEVNYPAKVITLTWETYADGNNPKSHKFAKFWPETLPSILICNMTENDFPQQTWVSKWKGTEIRIEAESLGGAADVKVYVNGRLKFDDLMGAFTFWVDLTQMKIYPAADLFEVTDQNKPSEYDRVVYPDEWKLSHPTVISIVPLSNERCTYRPEKCILDATVPELQPQPSQSRRYKKN